MFPRKQLSGNAKRNKKKAENLLTGSMKGSMDKFVQKNTNIVQENPTENLDDENIEPVEKVDSKITLNINQDPNVNNVVQGENVEPIENINGERIYNTNQIDSCLIIYDPRVWGGFDEKMKDLLVEKGRAREINFKYPRDKSGRHFSSEYYTRIFRNKTSYDRKWLVYSKELNRVFCFGCKLFKTAPSRSQLAEEGFSDWKHLSERLRAHENSREHFVNLRPMKELELRLKDNKTIDKELQEQVKKETRHWRGVMIRIVSVVKCLAILNLAFHGKNEKIDDDYNGNFLGLISMIAEFDSIMQEHFRLIREKETHYHYLSHKIQNELIATISSKVKSAIIEKVKKAKYCSVILDCIPDASHKEQMTLILRCVDVSAAPIEVEEYFIEFINVEVTTRLGLFETLIAALESLGFDVDNIRGQSYDNGSNMSGKH